jgi:arsenate reductase
VYSVYSVVFGCPRKAVAETGGDEEAQLDCYRAVRDQIKAFVETLPGALA